MYIIPSIWVVCILSHTQAQKHIYTHTHTHTHTQQLLTSQLRSMMHFIHSQDTDFHTCIRHAQHTEYRVFGKENPH